MSAKTGAIAGSIFGGATGGLLSAGLVEYLTGDTHYLPLCIGAILGGAIGGVLTALVTRGNLGDVQSAKAPDDQS